MKYLLTLSLCVGLFTLASATDGKYIEVMQKNIQVLYAGQSLEAMQNAINTLDRVGNTEKTQWEPFYYISFGYILMANLETDVTKKDAYLDLAKSAVDKATELKKDDSEITALVGFIYMIRVTVDPATRGPQYLPLATQAYQKALTLNAANPRAMALLAQLQFGTARFFGQAPTEACATTAKALALYAGDRHDDPLAPVWGKAMTEGLTKNCN